MIPAGESGPDTVVEIHHTRDAVKTEPIELILLDPKAQIAQKKAYDLVRAVVEQATVPKLMTAFSTFVKVQVVTTVEEIQAIENVFAGMGVDNIQKNYKTKTMGCVYQFFEIFREAITRTGSEKVGNLISER
jgi:hypothetical protein